MKLIGLVDQQTENCVSIRSPSVSSKSGDCSFTFRDFWAIARCLLLTFIAPYFILSPPQGRRKGWVSHSLARGKRLGCANDAKLYELHINNCMPNLTSLSLSPLQLLITLHSLLVMLPAETTIDPRELDTTAKLEADTELWLSNQKTKIFPYSSILDDFQSTVICVPWKWLRVLGCKPPVK